MEKEGEEIQREGTREDEVSIDEVELERREEGESERREEEELEIREEVEFEVEEREGMEEEQGEAPPRAQNENVLEMVAGDLSLSPTLCKMAVENLQAQASKMTKFSLDKFPPGKVGDTVRVRVPDVDRGRCDLRNILGVVTHVNHDNKTYKIGTQFGRINSSYACNQFTTCKEKLMQLENVPGQEGRGIKDALVKPSAVATDVLAVKVGKYVIRSVMEVFLVQISNYANFFYVSILRLMLCCFVPIIFYETIYGYGVKPYMGMV